MEIENCCIYSLSSHKFDNLREIIKLFLIYKYINCFLLKIIVSESKKHKFKVMVFPTI